MIVVSHLFSFALKFILNACVRIFYELGNLVRTL